MVGICEARYVVVGICEARYVVVGICEARYVVVGICEARYGVVWICEARYVEWSTIRLEKVSRRLRNMNAIKCFSFAMKA